MRCIAGTDVPRRLQLNSVRDYPVPLRHKSRPLLAAPLRLKNALTQNDLEMQLITIVIFAATAAFAQTAESQKPVTGAEKIADALRAGPEFVTKDATLLDWPSAPGGEYRVLRKGSSQWTCLPAVPGYPHDEPGCFDRVFLRWIQDGSPGARRASIASASRHVCRRLGKSAE